MQAGYLAEIEDHSLLILFLNLCPCLIIIKFQVFSKCPVGLTHYTTFNKAFEKCYAITGRAPGLASCVAAEMGVVSFGIKDQFRRIPFLKKIFEL